MNYIEAPEEYSGDGPAVFLAGGITDAGNWQDRLVEILSDLDATVLNPRRRMFPRDDVFAAQRQIEWEHQHLQRADLVAFWFPPQTLCPIALFELGICCGSGVPLLVGADPAYARRFDVCEQLRHRRPELKVLDRLEHLACVVAQHAVITGVGR